MTFSRVFNSGPGASPYADGPHADVNNDGREDLLAAAPNGISVRLAYGDGTYAPPAAYTGMPAAAASITTGDFNGDGFLDIIASDNRPNLYEYLNNGDGSFHLQATFVINDNVTGVVTADFNHDGKPDIAFNTGYGNTSSTPFVNVWTGNGDGGFTPLSRVTLSQGYFWLFVANFDGDANPDLMAENHDIGTNVEIFYGNGPGSGGSFTPAPALNPKTFVLPADVNGDGIEDLIDDYSYYTTNATGYGQELDIYYGHADRTFTSEIVPLSRCSSGQAAVADFNGDGIPDVALREYGSCDNSTSGTYISVLLRNADGTYQAAQDVYSTTTNTLGSPYVLRANADSKPDLVFTEDHYNGTSTDYGLSVLLNTSSGNFPSCAPPDAATGIHVCSPGSTASTSPVHFGIGASTQTPARKVEVWVDGAKVKEQLTHAFSYYGFLDADLDLSSGTHTIDVYAAGWDNMLEHTSFTTSVGSGGGTGSCPQPSSPGVNICSPANGSSVTSPFTISAAGKNTNGTSGMDVWLDGQKVGWYGGTSVDVQATAVAGSHQLDIYAVGSDGELKESTVSFTVTASGGGGGTCAIPSSPGVVICEPVNGSTTSSPFTISAAGRNTGTTSGMDVWIDGLKLGWYPGQTVYVQDYISPGTHQLDVYAVGSNGELQKATSTFTISGGGSTCGQPANPGVNICAPTQGSTVSSPVQVSATGKNSGATAGMDVWIDGNKIGWYSGTTVDIQIPNVPAGSHQLDSYAVGTNGELQESTVIFNVQ